MPLLDAGLDLFNASISARRLATSLSSSNDLRPIVAWTMPALSTRNWTWPALALRTACATSGVTVPTFGFGTVTPDVAQAVRNAKAGQVQFRVDKAGIVHATIGRRSFESDKLVANLRALIEALNKAKPASSKGNYLRKVALSSSMGVGARVDLASINAQAAQSA